MLRRVYLQDKLGDDRGILLITDVHDAGHREGWKTSRARAHPSGVADPPATALVNVDYVRLAANGDRDGDLGQGPILVQKLTDQLHFWIGTPLLHLTRIQNHEPRDRGYARIGQIRQGRWKAESCGIDPIPIVTDG